MMRVSFFASSKRYGDADSVHSRFSGSHQQFSTTSNIFYGKHHDDHWSKQLVVVDGYSKRSTCLNSSSSSCFAQPRSTTGGEQLHSLQSRLLLQRPLLPRLAIHNTTPHTSPRFVRGPFLVNHRHNLQQHGKWRKATLFILN